MCRQASHDHSRPNAHTYAKNRYTMIRTSASTSTIVWCVLSIPIIPATDHEAIRIYVDFVKFKRDVASIPKPTPACILASYTASPSAWGAEDCIWAK
jgi:hypothetical protein